MKNVFESKHPTIQESRHRSRESLIQHILDRNVDQIIRNIGKKQATLRDIANVVRKDLDQYKGSDQIRKMLGIIKYEKWDMFQDEIIQRIEKEIELRQKGKESTFVDSKTIKQKRLF